APRVAGGLHGLELVLEDRLGVEQEPTDQRGLAVVDRAGGSETQQVHQVMSPSPRPSRAAAGGVCGQAEEGGDADASATDDNAATRRPGVAQQVLGGGVMALEVAFLLPVLHGSFGEPVIASGRAALGDAGDGDLVDDLVERVGVG